MVLGCVSGVRSAARAQGRITGLSFVRTILERASVRSIDFARYAAILSGGLLVLALAPASGRAQNRESIFEKLGLDQLELVSLGVAAGRIDPAQVVPATVFALSADYGNVGPHWRIVFEASYWESRLSTDVVERFIDTLKTNIISPSGDFTIPLSRIPIYDVTLSAGTRWTTSQSTLVRPYLGGGLSAHVINAEGKLIKGTFVERSLDNISAGFYAAGGVELRPVPHVVFDGQARADLVSGFRSLQLRVGATYYLGSPRRPN